MSLVYIVSHVMRYLNNQEILKIPEFNEINTAAFSMFKDCIGLIPLN